MQTESERGVAADRDENGAIAHPLQIAGNELRLYTESSPLIGDMVRDIRAANGRVWMESYIFLGDAAGTAIGAALTPPQIANAGSRDNGSARAQADPTQAPYCAP